MFTKATNIKEFKNKTICISGPIELTGCPFSVDNFSNVEVYLRNAGFSSIKNPASIFNTYGFGNGFEFYLKKSMELLLASDTLYVFGDSKNATITKELIELAHKLRMPVFFEEYNEL